VSTNNHFRIILSLKVPKSNNLINRLCNGRGVTMNDLFLVKMNVNGKEIEEYVEPRKQLSEFIRETLSLTGTHIGCEHGVCGACTILVNGEAVRSCLMLTVQADGCNVQTVEALQLNDGSLHPLQQAFTDNHALQCGFCTPGILMSMVSYLKEIREAISGNLCRCTGYTNIIKAVKSASKALTSSKV
jgi:aerobic-type carbon monoxide dehydrogenase small subunit (CoxS/CutS family)